VLPVAARVLAATRVASALVAAAAAAAALVAVVAVLVVVVVYVLTPFPLHVPSLQMTDNDDTDESFFRFHRLRKDKNLLTPMLLARLL
jgi:hypothetical protein